MSEHPIETDGEDWHARADELHEEGGVPPVRARVVALRETGLTYREVADRLGQSGKEEVGWHIRQYRKQRDKAAWLVENAAEL